MKIIVNGNEQQIEKPLNVIELLSLLNVESPDMVSVELNGSILLRAEHQTTAVKENDTLEFLYFMGGGSSAAVRSSRD